MRDLGVLALGSRQAVEEAAAVVEHDGRDQWLVNAGGRTVSSLEEIVLALSYRTDELQQVVL